MNIIYIHILIILLFIANKRTVKKKKMNEQHKQTNR